jgi:NAD(P)H-flavin reductase
MMMMMMKQKLLLAILIGLSLLIASSHAFTRALPTFHRTVVAVSSKAPTPSYSVAEVAQQQQQYRQHHHHHAGSRKVQHVLFMGWGPDPIWSTATVTLNEKACSSGLSVVLNVKVSPDTAAEYTVPGQYVQVRRDDNMEKPLFLAIASGPSKADDENAAPASSFEFLVKKTDGNEWLTSIKPGTAIQVSQVLGKGFAIQENLESFKYDFPTQNILLFAAGSGLAPIKAAMESGLLNVKVTPGGRTCRLYYGERTQGDLCYVQDYSKWEAAGIEVVPVLSQPDEDDTSSWQGRSGYVQNALEEDGIAVPRNSGALLCGMKGMTESVKDILTKAGVFEGRVLFNF